jgi:hypothetical protein
MDASEPRRVEADKNTLASKTNGQSLLTAFEWEEKI